MTDAHPLRRCFSRSFIFNRPAQSTSMFLARIVLFRLQESPKFLTAAHRHDEAVIALQRISHINGQDRIWGLMDVVDDDSGLGHGQLRAGDEEEGKGRRTGGTKSEEEEGDEMDAFVLGGEEEDEHGEHDPSRHHEQYGNAASSHNPGSFDYNSTAESSSLHLAGANSGTTDSTNESAIDAGSAIRLEPTGLSIGHAQGQRFPPRGPPPSLLRHPSRTPLQSRRLASYRSGSGSGNKARKRGHSSSSISWLDRLPRGVRNSVDEYAERFDELFEPQWRRTTTLIWLIWLLASAGYTVSGHEDGFLSRTGPDWGVT